MVRDKRKSPAAMASAKSISSVVLRMHMWFETEQGVAFGMGRLLLLSGIEECGSLKAAAEKLGMGYRAAWGKLKETERILGVDLIEKASGNRAGYTLTENGRRLAACFRQWFEAVENTAVDQANRMLPFKVTQFHRVG